MFKKESNTLLNFLILLIFFVLIFYILYIWASLIIPLIIAALFSFAIIWLSNFYKKLKIWSFLAFALSLWTYIFIFWWIWTLIGSNIEDLIRLLPSYQDRVSEIFVQVFKFFHLEWVINLNNIFNKINVASIVSNVAQTVSDIFSSAWIILFYVMFILLEYRYFKDKLDLMINDWYKKKQVFEILEKIRTDVKSYFVIKCLVSLVTASLSYIVMYSFNLDFAIFWALLIFVLNFIPSVGSIIAVSFPALLSMIQFEIYYFIVLMISLLVMIQVLMWNIIEPKFMGNKLNLSPLVIIIALWFWWSIWWIVWMLLSVPIMVIINIIFAKIPATRPIAILLSEKWELQVEWWEEVIKARREILKWIKNKFTKKKKKIIKK